MISIIQRVTQSDVKVENRVIGSIERGIMALIAVEHNDTEQTAQRLLDRIINYRIFPDANYRMNLNLGDIDGGLLLIPQFTLAANTRNGNRPSFTSAASPAHARMVFEMLLTYAQKKYHTVAAGQFGADMQVALINDGPVTFTLTTGA